MTGGRGEEKELARKVVAAQPYKVTNVPRPVLHAYRARSRDLVLSVKSKSSRRFNHQEFWVFNERFKKLKKNWEFQVSFIIYRYQHRHPLA